MLTAWFSCSLARLPVSFHPRLIGGDQEAMDTREMAGVSSSTTATAKPGKLGRLRARSLAAGAESHLDWRSEGADLIEFVWPLGSSVVV